jgi:hypothetical protein
MKIYLDDLRPCPQGFEIARTVEEAIRDYKDASVFGCNIKILSLDHDLGGLDGTYTKTGYDFCLWLVEEFYNDNIDFPYDIYLHTSNPVGRENMLQLLNRYKPYYTTIHRAPMPFYNADGTYKED